ncbi:hypothetical protein [Mycolicibacter minnesotensis]
MPESTDTGSLPLTEPHMAPIFDTGPHPTPLPGPADEAAAEPFAVSGPTAWSEPDPDQTASIPLPKPSKPLVVTGQYQSLKWWQLALVLLAVWIPAAGIGLGLFSWWFAQADKTPVVFTVLVYAVVCVVAGLIVAMLGEKPLVSAVAIALMSAVFASAVAAAPLYGHHYCQHVSRCVGGILPY